MMAKLKVGDKLPKIEEDLTYRCGFWDKGSTHKTNFNYGEYVILKITETEYHFDSEDSSINDTNFIVEIQEIDQYIKDENMKQYKDTAQNKIYRSFAILGTKSLLRAMEEELNLVGYKSSQKYSFIDGTAIGNILGSRYFTSDNLEKFKSLSANDNVKGDVQFQLPQQWEECLTFCKEQLQPQFKVGDWVVWKMDNHIGKIVKECSTYKNCWFLDREYNSCSENGLRLATKEEIEKATKIEVGEYEMEMSNGKAVFGCQYITKEDINTFKKFIGHPINAKVIIHNTEITTELLNKILNKLP